MRHGRGRLRLAFLVSAAIHAGVVAIFWAIDSAAEPLPTLRVYAVDIVSPPPREAGEWSPEPEPQPVEETPEEPEPEPVPPPEPEPTPPRPEPTPPRTEPSPAQRPTTTPEPPRREPERPREQPRPEQPRPEPPRQQTPPSTGQRPDPASTGGEDLNVRVEGARFVDPEYLANIQRQINRYFRRPSEARTDVAEVRFYINRDGSVSDIALVTSTGSFAFRAAAMEAVEQAGINRAFGPLPSAYTADRLLVSFYFRPAR